MDVAKQLSFHVLQILINHSVQNCLDESNQSEHRTSIVICYKFIILTSGVLNPIFRKITILAGALLLSIILTRPACQKGIGEF